VGGPQGKSKTTSARTYWRSWVGPGRPVAAAPRKGGGGGGSVPRRRLASGAGMGRPGLGASVGGKEGGCGLDWG
jgi:hypothetical protein